MGCITSSDACLMQTIQGLIDSMDRTVWYIFHHDVLGPIVITGLICILLRVVLRRQFRPPAARLRAGARQIARINTLLQCRPEAIELFGLPAADRAAIAAGRKLLCFEGLSRGRAREITSHILRQYPVTRRRRRRLTGRDIWRTCGIR